LHLAAGNRLSPTITFESRGSKQLKGVPDEWALFVVTA
jgi:hypothetical protein